MANITLNAKPRGSASTNDGLLYQEGVITAGIHKSINVQAGTSDNDAIPTVGHVNDRIPLSEIAVNSINDFPTPTDTGDGNGVAIHLETGKAYILGTYIETSDPIIAPDAYGQCAILSHASSVGIALIYTGTGIAFKDSNKKFGYFTLRGLSIGAASGTLFDFECDDPNVEAYFSIEDCWTWDIERLGYIRANVSADIFWSAIYYFNHGITVDSSPYFAFTLSWMSGYNAASSKYIRILGSNGDISLAQSYFYPDTNETAFDIDPASSVNAGIIANSTVEGAGTFFEPGGKDQTDPYWNSNGTRGIPNSRVFINQYVKIAEAAAPITSFTALNDPVLINNVFNYGEQERLSGTTDGRITYTGLERYSGLLHYSITLVKPTAGTNDKFQLTPGIEDAVRMLITSIADPGAGEIDIVTNNPHEILTGDRFTLFNMTVGGYDGTYTVNSVPNSTTLRVTATFTSTATGEWRKLLLVERKEIELDANEPSSVTMFASLENLQTGNVYVMVVEALTDATDQLKFYDVKSIIL